MPYSVVSTKIDVLDLALEFERDKNVVSKKFHNQYLEVIGEISKIDEEKKLVEIEYVDVDSRSRGLFIKPISVRASASIGSSFTRSISSICPPSPCSHLAYPMT